jgi:hypothetical protein
MYFSAKIPGVISSRVQWLNAVAGAGNMVFKAGSYFTQLMNCDAFFFETKTGTSGAGLS